MTKRNPLVELGRFGVSPWYDNISRSLLASGALQRMIEADGVRGVTSNPAIFEKAIGSSSDYDEAICGLARQGKSSQQIYEALAVEDIRAAADLLARVYEESKAADGYVSLEVSPSLAHDAAGTKREALRLFKLVGRPNVMIKIPGTAEGVGAVEEVIAEGVPVNVTLLFSQERYAEVFEAYTRGLERRAKTKKDLSRVASVASFFVSRVDAALDKQLPPELRGKAAVANAKLAYSRYKRSIAEPRWKTLAAAGARPQRLLWASTGTKNPNYRDVLYVEELIGPDTVNTIPPATLDAFRDHGACRPSLEEDLAQAREVWTRVCEKADVPAALAALEKEGVAAFVKSFETLLGQLAAKREMIQAEAGVVDAGLEELKKAMFVQRLWAKDAALWKDDAAHQKIIKNSLGWLTVADAMAAGLGQIRTFVSEIKSEGFETAVVLGMGGSSLACEVFRACFPVAKGHPRLEVLDTTSPGAVAALSRRLDLSRALFIVSSKSGGTIEPNCFMERFWADVEKLSKGARGAPAGRQFVAITDPGTSLEKLARARGFRKIFTNPADIGGRYSALSFFGLVPAALMGVDVEKLLTRAREAARAFGPSEPTESNRALRLGAAMGMHARRGQDKLTVLLPPSLEAFGLWIEQLVAESSGKEGKGIVPIVGEPTEAPERYGRDRLFVRLDLPDAADLSVAELEKAGHPALALKLDDVYDLGEQFLLWEIATAAACRLLGVDPFDQPDVQSAKDQTKRLLEGLEDGRLPSEKPALRAGGAAAFCDEELSRRLLARSSERMPSLPLADVLAEHLARLEEGDYVALLAFVDPTEDARMALERARRALRRRTKAAVCVEFGPRYLHSTGQLHKGGADNGVFIELVEAETTSLPVPGQPFTFGTLCRAQALGDFAALLAAGRRALRLDLAEPGAKPLEAFANALEQLGERGACAR